MARNLEGDQAYIHNLTVRERLIEEGAYPYPQEGHKTHTNIEALEQSHGSEVTVAGRITAMRGHGGMRFVDIQDESGDLQVVIKKDEVKDIERMDNISAGDYLRVTGERMVTRSGEESVLAVEFDLLTKALRPLPDGWGSVLKDKEKRYRQRAVDLAVHPDVREVFRKRTQIIASVRETLNGFKFMEVETPTLQPLYGGANARPFTTHINAWDIDMYLRISPELYLKHLIMGGFDMVYEITKNFRNEGADKTHNPEFTMMECYAAYWDYGDMMDLTEEIYENAARAANGTPIVNYQGVEIDFSQPWRRITMKQAIVDYLGVNVDKLSDPQLKKAIKKQGLEYEGEWIRGLAIATLFEAVEPELIQPTFITDFPRETTSLCKPHRDDPALIERFEPYIMGWEVGNAYTELNDPVLQRQFWEEERADDEEAHPLDETFLTAMEYGMAPTGGLGLGMDRMVMLLTNQITIRDVIFFPTMKPAR